MESKQRRKAEKSSADHHRQQSGKEGIQEAIVYGGKEDRYAKLLYSLVVFEIVVSYGSRLVPNTVEPSTYRPQFSS